MYVNKHLFCVESLNASHSAYTHVLTSTVPLKLKLHFIRSFKMKAARERNRQYICFSNCCLRTGILVLMNIPLCYKKFYCVKMVPEAGKCLEILLNERQKWLMGQDCHL